MIFWTTKRTELVLFLYPFSNQQISPISQNTTQGIGPEVVHFKDPLSIDEEVQEELGALDKEAEIETIPHHCSKAPPFFREKKKGQDQGIEQNLFRVPSHHTDSIFDRIK